jgi:hypothetical protein
MIEGIKKRIKQVEEELLKEVNPTNYDYYDKLLDIHRKLSDLLYFKVNLEKGFLLK